MGAKVIATIAVCSILAGCYSTSVRMDAETDPRPDGAADTVSEPALDGHTGDCTWSLPLDSPIDLTAHTVSIGRLWAVPDPLVIWPEEDGSGFVQVYLQFLSGESAFIDSIRIEGSSDFTMPTLSRIPLPVEMPDASQCPTGTTGCCGMMVLELYYTPSGEPPGDIWLVVQLDDLIDSTVRVPIIIDHDGLISPPPHSGWWLSVVSVDQNPIRIELLRRDARTTTELCLTYNMGSYDGPTVTDISVIGPGLSLLGARYEDGSPYPLTMPFREDRPTFLDLEYVSTGEPVDGLLLITSLNGTGEEVVHGVPIIIC